MKRRLAVLFLILMMVLAVSYSRAFWLPLLEAQWPGFKKFVEENANFFQGLSGLVQVFLWIAAPIVALWWWLVDRKAVTPSSVPDPSPNLQSPISIAPDPAYPRYGIARLPEHFIRRPKEMDRIRKELLRPDRPGKLALLGMGGLGKTTLARAVAFEPACKSVYPDGVLWGELGPSAVSDNAADKILNNWLRDLNAGDPKELPEIAAKVQRLRGFLSDKRMLIIIDDLWQSSLAHPLIEIAGERCGLLLTARDRRQIVSLPVQPLDLAVLEKAEALAMLAARLGRQLSDDETNQAAEVAQRLGYLPLAIELAGALLAQPGRGWQWLLGKLSRSAGSLQTLQTGDASLRQENLEICMQLSWQALPAEAQSPFAWLGVMAADGSFTAAEAEQLWQLAEEPANDLLLLLTDSALLDRLPQQDGSDCYRLHTLLRDFALHQLQRRGETDAALLCHATLYADLAEAASHWRQLASIHPQLQAALRRCWRAWMSAAPTELQIAAGLQLPAAEAKPLLDRLIFACENGYWDLAGLYNERIIWLPRAIYAAAQADDKRDQGAHLGNLGLAYADLGQVEKAIGNYEAALAISREIGDRRGEGAHLGNLGNAYRNLGQVEKAIGNYEAALAISREIGDRRGEGNHLGNLGNAYRDLGQVEKARSFLEQSLAIFQEIKSPSAAQAQRLLDDLSKESDA